MTDQKLRRLIDRLTCARTNPDCSCADCDTARMLESQYSIIERLTAEVQSAFESGWSMYADNGLQPRVPDQMKHAYKHWKSTLSGSQDRCEITLTERFDNPECACNTYPDNLGPCKTFKAGSNGNCVYCDHNEECHISLLANLSGSPTQPIALHASAPSGCKCSDCEIDQEPCPTCYAAWWRKRHPYTTLIESDDSNQVQP